jgi:uncharacterized protein YqgC (DUF456 family)
MDVLGQIALPLALLAVMLFGLVSLVFLPILPGLVIIWAAALGYGVLGHFGSPASIIVMVVITLLMLAGSLIDNIFMGASARKTGASWVSVTVSLLAGVAGSFIWPPLGGILFSLVGLFAAEFLRLHNWRKALSSTRSMAIGCGWAVAARFIGGLVMIGLYLTWVLIF